MFKKLFNKLDLISDQIQSILNRCDLYKQVEIYSTQQTILKKLDNIGRNINDLNKYDTVLDALSKKGILIVYDEYTNKHIIKTKMD